jgi:DnaJ like chaperone protein
MKKHRGKLFGAALGFSFGGPIGAMIGGAVGALFDAADSTMGTTGTPSGRTHQTTLGDAQRELVFITSLILLLIGTARADGPVTESEIATIKKFFKDLGYTGREYFLIERIIKTSQTREVNLQYACADITSRTSYEERLFLVKLGYDVAMSDGRITRLEEEYIREAAKYLGILEYDFAMIRNSFKTAGYSKERFGAVRSETPYDILGISSDCTDEELHHAYRGLVSRYHPDKVSHLGVEFIELANKKFNQIQAAYQAVKQERGFS